MIVDRMFRIRLCGSTKDNRSRVGMRKYIGDRYFIEYHGGIYGCGPVPTADLSDKLLGSTDDLVSDG